MSRFALKIFAVLLVMAALPLAVSTLFIYEVSTYEEGIYREALDAIRESSEIKREWLRSEANRVELISAQLSAAPPLATIAHANTPSEVSEAQVSEAIAYLEPAIERFDLLYRVTIKVGPRVVVDAGDPSALESGTLRRYDRRYDLRTGQAIQTQSLSLGPGPKSGAVVVMQLTVGLQQETFDRFDRLGDQRVLFRTFLQTGSDNQLIVERAVQRLLTILIPLCIGLSIVLALVLTIPTSRQIARLAQATRKVASDDLSVQIPAKGNDELAELSRQFNVMVRDLRDARRKLQYLERVSAWQEVAKRLAHEIKNPLTPLLLAIQQLDRKFSDYEERPQRYRMLVTEVVEIVTEEVETLQKLVKEFSEFARLPPLDPKPVRFEHFVAQVLRHNPQLEQNADLVVCEGDEDIWVKIDTTLMRRVVINLFQNAIEAAAPVVERPYIEHCCRRVGDMAVLTIADNGTGIAEDNLARLFEPYFTTKETGTGLGLAIVRKIVIDHGGDVQLHNRRTLDAEGQITPHSASCSGAEVHVMLPLQAAPETATSIIEEESYEGDAL